MKLNKLVKIKIKKKIPNELWNLGSCTFGNILFIINCLKNKPSSSLKFRLSNKQAKLKHNNVFVNMNARFYYMLYYIFIYILV